MEKGKALLLGVLLVSGLTLAGCGESEQNQYRNLNQNGQRPADTQQNKQMPSEGRQLNNNEMMPPPSEAFPAESGDTTSSTETEESSTTTAE